MNPDLFQTFSNIAIAVGTMIVALGTLGHYYFGNLATKAIQQLTVEEIQTSDYPPRIDIRLRNSGSTPVAITKVYLHIADFKEGWSPVGKQEISDSVTVNLDEQVKQGDTLSGSLSVKVPANDLDRVAIVLGWKGESPDIGKFYMVIPALKTSAGILRCEPVVVHIQEDSVKSADRYKDPSFVLKPLGLITREQATSKIVDWPTD